MERRGWSIGSIIFLVMGGSREGCDVSNGEREKERARDRSITAIMEWCSLMCLLLFFVFSVY
jgi:hypothetical protein